MKQKLGQNFLTDKRVAEREVDYANITHDDVVLEIGPGHGILTKLLAEKAKKVVAIELDKDYPMPHYWLAWIDNNPKVPIEIWSGHACQFLSKLQESYGQPVVGDISWFGARRDTIQAMLEYDDIKCPTVSNN